MKSIILTASLLAAVTASSFGQGAISFKTSITKNPVFSATDGTSNSLALIPTSGTVGSFGAVTYAFLTAPSSTPLLTSLTPGITPSGWTLTIADPVTYTAPGVFSEGPQNPQFLPASAGAPGAAVDLEVIAFTGTYASPTLFGYSGATAGELSWVQATGNISSFPPSIPTPINFGANGLGSMVLEPVAAGPVVVPEPSTLVLGGLGAAALLTFRRRKQG